MEFQTTESFKSHATMDNG